jgi:hypothetical protein
MYKLPAAGPSFAVHLAIVTVAWLARPVMAVASAIGLKRG